MNTKVFAKMQKVIELVEAQGRPHGKDRFGRACECEQCETWDAAREIFTDMRTEAREITKMHVSSLLSDIGGLLNPDYRALNRYSEPNSRLLHACMCAYAKHVLDSPEIGWDQLGDILHSAILNELGDKGFAYWMEQVEHKKK